MNMTVDRYLPEADLTSVLYNLQSLLACQQQQQDSEIIACIYDVYSFTKMLQNDVCISACVLILLNWLKLYIIIPKCGESDVLS